MPRLLNVSRILPALIFSAVLTCAAMPTGQQADVPYFPTPPPVVKRMPSCEGWQDYS